jgi:hypothetical protein
MVEGLEAAPGFTGGRNVNECEKNSRDKLECKDGERGAAEDVPPAGGVARHGMLGNFANGSRELEAAIEPFANLSADLS